MIDPASAIAACTLAFNGIKKAVSVGKEISELGKDLSTFGKAVSDLTILAQRRKTLLCGKRSVLILTPVQ